MHEPILRRTSKPDRQVRHLTLGKERFLKVFLVINSRLNNLTENGNEQKKNEKRIKRVSRLNCSFFFPFIFFSSLFFFLSKFLELFTLNA